VRAPRPPNAFARNLLRLAAGGAAGLAAGLLVYTVVSFVVSERIRDLRKSASHQTKQGAVR
jgi:hypothetical protein